MTYRLQQQRNLEDTRRKEEAARNKELVKSTVQDIMMCTQEYAEGHVSYRAPPGAGPALTKFKDEMTDRITKLGDIILNGKDANTSTTTTERSCCLSI